MKIAIINRAVPGSGKTTFTEILREKAEKQKLTFAVHSTDDLCMVDGKYSFDISKAQQRHEQNYKNFSQSLDAGINIVVCDNTNIKLKDYRNYALTAHEKGYKVVSVVFLPDSVENHIKRNTHSVPSETISKMRSNLTQNIKSKYVDYQEEINFVHPYFPFKEHLNYVAGYLMITCSML